MAIAQAIDQQHHHLLGVRGPTVLRRATHPDPDDGSVIDRKDGHIKAAVLFAAPGSGQDLTEQAARSFPFLYPDFSAMTTPALIVVGDHDMGGLSTRGPAWWRDAFDLSPSPKTLFTAFGGEHALGGIPGYEARETTDERPQRVAAIQRLSAAFLRSVLYPGDPAFFDAAAAIAADPPPEGHIETK